MQTEISDELKSNEKRGSPQRDREREIEIIIAKKRVGAKEEERKSEIERKGKGFEKAHM